MKKLITVFLVMFVSLLTTSQTLKMMSGSFFDSEFNEEYETWVNEKEYKTSCFFVFNETFTAMSQITSEGEDYYLLSDPEKGTKEGTYSYLVTDINGSKYILVTSSSTGTLTFIWDSQGKLVARQFIVNDAWEVE